MFQKLKANLSIYSSILSFYLLAWIVHLFLISGVAFFHFRLDHRLIVIENWIFDYAWTLALISKVVSFIFFWKYLFEQNYRTFSGAIESSSKEKINFDIIFLSLFNLILILYFLSIKRVDNVVYSAVSMLTHFVSVFFVFFIDLMVFKIFTKEETSFSVTNIIFSAIILYSYKLLIFPFGEQLGISFFSLIIMFFIYFYQFEKKYVNSSVFVLVVLCPLFAILGLDPVWGSKFSLYSLNIFESRWTIFYVLPFVTYFYFYRRRNL